jgi:hypothetical protein
MSWSLKWFFSPDHSNFIVTAVWPSTVLLVWRVSSSGMWPRVVCWVATDVSEEHIASIFRVEEIILARTSK